MFVIGYYVSKALKWNRQVTITISPRKKVKSAPPVKRGRERIAVNYSCVYICLTLFANWAPAYGTWNSKQKELKKHSVSTTTRNTCSSLNCTNIRVTRTSRTGRAVLEWRWPRRTLRRFEHAIRFHELCFHSLSSASALAEQQQIVDRTAIATSRTSDTTLFFAQVPTLCPTRPTLSDRHFQQNLRKFLKKFQKT